MEQTPLDTLIVDPPKDLHFVGPFSRQIRTYISLTNPTNSNILFKIKTTAPKRYCVRPNCGIILPKMTISIEIRLQPFLYNPSENCKQKFMIQSVISSDQTVDDFNKIWEKTTPEQIMNSKLRCILEMPTIVPKMNESLNDTKAIDLINVLKESPLKIYPIFEVPPNCVNEEKSQPMMQTFFEPADSLCNEINQLREENKTLRKQALNLKEEVRQLPMASDSFAPIVVQRPTSAFFIALIIALGIFGMLLGKFIF